MFVRLSGVQSLEYDKWASENFQFLTISPKGELQRSLDVSVMHPHIRLRLAYLLIHYALQDIANYGLKEPTE